MIIELRLIEGKTMQSNFVPTDMSFEFMNKVLSLFDKETKLVCQINLEMDILNNASGNSRDQALRVQETYRELQHVRSILRGVKQLYCLGI